MIAPPNKYIYKLYKWSGDSCTKDATDPTHLYRQKICGWFVDAPAYIYYITNCLKIAENSPQIKLK